MRQNRLKIIFATIVISAVTTGSAAADGWWDFGRRGERGSGDIVTEQREVASFERIRLDCSADLVITVGEEASVAVTTDDNLQEYIITEVISRKDPVD